MAYQEIYPLNDSPSGDTKREAILKNRQEMLNIADKIDKKSNGNGSGGGLRNRVLSGSVSGGQYNYLSGDSLSVAIDGTVTPVVVTFANGFDINGAVDYVKSITARATPWVVPANTTSYLYLDYNVGTGAINYGSTTIKPVISNTPPENASTNMHYYNEMLAKTFYYNGIQWVDKVRVFIAAVKTTSTSVSDIIYLERSDNTITSKQIGNSTIQTINLSDDSITTTKIKNKSVTLDKLSDDVTTAINTAVNNVLDKVYPIGSIYCSTIATDPHELFGFGKWTYIEQGRVLLSQGSNFKAGTMGGESMHTLTLEEAPWHNHNEFTDSSGAHTHNRGTMEIAGNVWATVGPENGVTGVFTYDAEGQGFSNWTNHSKDGRLISFLASRNWTGLTSEEGEHSHKIAGDGGNQPHNNMQPYLAVYMWQRES